MASSSAARSAGSHSASARSRAACATAKSSASTPSSRAVISRTAWAPRMRTSSHSGRTVAITESMSVAARGSRSASSRWAGSADPRRSMRVSTGTSGRAGETPQGSQWRRPGRRPPYARGMGDLIPLFPLGTPLFPGVVLPLHVFEPRYRRLMRDLMSLPEQSDRRFFGVVAIRQGWEVERVAPADALYDVGCTARVRRVAAQPDGGFAIVTVGGDRFRLLDVVVGDDPPYLQGEIEWLADEEAAEEYAGDADGLLDPASVDARRRGGPGARLDGVLVGGVARLFADYVTRSPALGRRTGTRGARPPNCCSGTDDPAALSWLVASAALLTTEDRQALLAESATRRRLAAEARVLRRELTLLRPWEPCRCRCDSSPPP